MNYGDREKSTLPDSPIESYIASWKERRKYALLQAASSVMAGILVSHGGNSFASQRELSILQAELLLSEIESRLPESAE